MALIQCYECSREISDKARTCPHCGAPRDDVSVKVDGNQSVDALTIYHQKYSDLIRVVLEKATRDSREDAAWRIFGFEEKPKLGRVFGYKEKPRVGHSGNSTTLTSVFGLGSRDMVAQEYALFREIFLSSVAVSCIMMVDPEDPEDPDDRDEEDLARLGNIIIAHLLRNSDGQQIAKEWGLKSPVEVKRKANTTFRVMFDLFLSIEMLPSRMMECLKDSLPGGYSMARELPKEWLVNPRDVKRTPSESELEEEDHLPTPSEAFFEVLFSGRHTASLKGKVSELEKWADEVGISEQDRLLESYGNTTW